jgi:hypothetical protein
MLRRQALPVAGLLSTRAITRLAPGFSTDVGRTCRRYWLVLRVWRCATNRRATGRFDHGISSSPVRQCPDTSTAVALATPEWGAEVGSCMLRRLPQPDSDDTS